MGVVRADQAIEYRVFERADAKGLADWLFAQKLDDEEVLIWQADRVCRDDNWTTKYPRGMQENIKKFESLVAEHRANIDWQNMPQGFSLHTSGRDGHIYYREDDRLMEIYVELSGIAKYSFLVGEEGLSHWILPEESMLTQQQRDRIAEKLRQWLDEQEYKSDFNISGTV